MTDENDIPVDHPKSAPEDRETTGPLDLAEANPVRPYVDLGGIKVPPQQDLGMRLEVEESGQRVVAVTLDLAGSTLQIQPFAAPRSSGLWHEFRAQILEQLASQGVSAEEVDGPFGPEVRARIPAPPDATPPGPRDARFIGVDGPRWMLRGVITGPGATREKDAGAMDDLFRSIVVVRGGSPMPPRELIPLNVPAGATPA